MKIGNIDLGERPVMLAPMEDVTDVSFRQICREQGADMVYTEFVSADAVIRNIDSTLRKMVINPGERPAAIQIYGRELEPMVEAAKIAEEAKPEVLDINFGCPVKKVARKGAGAGMLQNVPLLLEITREVVKAVNLPVTVKTRLGWDCNNKIIVELAEQLQDCGIKARMTIPIIGNGDITTPQKLAEYYDRYGVDGIMVGRASIGAPWIFREMKQYLLTGEIPEISRHEKMALIRRQIDESIDRIDEYRGILHIRRHLAATPLFKGIKNFRDTRIAMLRANTKDELTSILDHIENDIFPSLNA